MSSLYVVELTYTSDISAVDAEMDGHRAFLEAQYAAGRFVASGRKVPRTGGVILARGDRAELENALESDPFYVHGLAEYRVVEFEPTMSASDVILSN